MSELRVSVSVLSLQKDSVEDGKDVGKVLQQRPLPFRKAQPLVPFLVA